MQFFLNAIISFVWFWFVLLKAYMGRFDCYVHFAVLFYSYKAYRFSLLANLFMRYTLFFFLAFLTFAFNPKKRANVDSA